MLIFSSFSYIFWHSKLIDNIEQPRVSCVTFFEREFHKRTLSHLVDTRWTVGISLFLTHQSGAFHVAWKRRESIIFFVLTIFAEKQVLSLKNDRDEFLDLRRLYTCFHKLSTTYKLRTNLEKHSFSKFERFFSKTLRLA